MRKKKDKEAGRGGFERILSDLTDLVEKLPFFSHPNAKSGIIYSRQVFVQRGY